MRATIPQAWEINLDDEERFRLTGTEYRNGSERTIVVYTILGDGPDHVRFVGNRVKVNGEMGYNTGAVTLLTWSDGPNGLGAHLERALRIQIQRLANLTKDYVRDAKAVIES